MPSRVEDGLLHIGGRWRPGADGGTRAVRDPATGAELARVAEATPVDASEAVAAARHTFEDTDWSRTPTSERAALLERIADLLERDRESIARLETLDTGKTLRESLIDVDDVAAVFHYYAGLIAASTDRRVDVGDRAVISRVVAEPVGVCAAIAPWNYPLLQMAWKVAPAVAAGCTIVAKPSELTPLSTVALVRLVEEAGLPPGVLNLLLGAGPSVGATLVTHPDVALISFTGGAATGVGIARVAADRLARVALELGGKNPHIVFADADLDAAVDGVLTGVFVHAGQVCSAGTRLIVEEAIADAVVAGVVERARGLRLGPGLDPASQIGPLVSPAHRAKIEAYVELGVAEGAQLLCGGRRPDDPRLRDGCFFEPTVFDRCDATMRIVREETFGPILTVERFRTEDEAIQLGNDTGYGLAAGVRTADPVRADRVARRLRHGTIWLNDFGAYTPAAEWGGFKRSGIGRELGPSGLREYQELKHVWTRTVPSSDSWFTRPLTATHRRAEKDADRADLIRKEATCGERRRQRDRY